jgi:hypothetical protein
MAPSRTRVPPFLAAAFLGFVAVLVALVLASMVRRDVAEFQPSPDIGPPSSGDAAAVESGAVDTVTVDARNPERWRFLSFRRGGVLPGRDTAAWDLAFRRFHVVSSGAVADAGQVEFDSLRSAPAAGYVTTRLGRDTVNAALDRWYRYSFVTHLLNPLNRVYVVRTGTGRYAKLQFLGYYCPGTVPGCVTVRYANLRGGAPD